MSQILSQDEVNALLGAVAEGAVPAGDGPAGPSGAIRTLDLTKQERNARGLPGLELVAERFAHGLRATCGEWFGSLPVVTVRALELVRTDGFLGGLTGPVVLEVFRLTPLRGHGLLIVPSPLLAALLQLFFGGNPARPTTLPDRERSAIELRVLERVAGRLLHDFQEAWAPIEPLACTLVRTETNPLRAAIAGAQDLLLQIDVQVEIPGGEVTLVTIVVPNAALDPLQARLAAGPTESETDGPVSDPAWTARLRRALVEAEVEVSAELGTQEVPLRRVLAFKPGDVIALGTGRDGPVVVRVEGHERFIGAPGVSGGNNAVRVTACG
jgi:flagellar motor switch protein FliM